MERLLAEEKSRREALEAKYQKLRIKLNGQKVTSANDSNIEPSSIQKAGESPGNAHNQSESQSVDISPRVLKRSGSCVDAVAQTENDTIANMAQANKTLPKMRHSPPPPSVSRMLSGPAPDATTFNANQNSIGHASEAVRTQRFPVVNLFDPICGASHFHTQSATAIVQDGNVAIPVIPASARIPKHFDPLGTPDRPDKLTGTEMTTIHPPPLPCPPMNQPDSTSSSVPLVIPVPVQHDPFDEIVTRGNGYHHDNKL